MSKTAAPGQIPDNVIFSFYIGAFFLLFTILWTVFTTSEYSPAENAKFYPEETPEEESKGLLTIITDFKRMPVTMRQLGLVQFFSWFALFSMWVFTTPAVAQHIYHVAPNDTASARFADARN